MTGLEMGRRWAIQAATGPEDEPALEAVLAALRLAEGVIGVVRDGMLVYGDEDVALLTGPAREPVTDEDRMADHADDVRKERLLEGRGRDR